MEISVNTQDIDNLESFSDFEFFKFFWEKYQEPTNVRFEKHRVRLTSAFNTERPKLTKDDIYTMEKFVNTLDDSFFPKFIWNEDGTHELYTEPLLERLKSIVKDLTTAYKFH